MHHPVLQNPYFFVFFFLRRSILSQGIGYVAFRQTYYTAEDAMSALPTSTRPTDKKKNEKKPSLTSNTTNLGEDPMSSPLAT
jgi:hypothetical protein